jgi:hypothetical protein
VQECNIYKCTCFSKGCGKRGLGDHFIRARNVPCSLAIDVARLARLEPWATISSALPGTSQPSIEEQVYLAPSPWCTSSSNDATEIKKYDLVEQVCILLQLMFCCANARPGIECDVLHVIQEDACLFL